MEYGVFDVEYSKFSSSSASKTEGTDRHRGSDTEGGFFAPGTNQHSSTMDDEQSKSFFDRIYREYEKFDVEYHSEPSSSSASKTEGTYRHRDSDIEGDCAPGTNRHSSTMDNVKFQKFLYEVELELNDPANSMHIDQGQEEYKVRLH